MQKLVRDDLYSLEDYAEIRPEFRARVMAHKQRRRVPIGADATLYFEDRMTIQYQVQEMLRAERIFEAAGIQEELDAYNPLIPDGNNWKATLMMEYPDEEIRRQRLAELVGIEDCVWVQVSGFDQVLATADEDMPRETEEKTSSVHFLRFELSREQVGAVKAGAAIAMGIQHANYQASVDPLDEASRAALAGDLD
jgi:hypothetical protein